MNDKHINYIEFRSTNITETKLFYSSIFSWTFEDYGPNYCSFQGAGIDGGFTFTENKLTNGVLVVIYSENLEELKQAITNSTGEITKEIFEFPGGKRFHFTDPSGNELAAWTDK